MGFLNKKRRYFWQHFHFWVSYSTSNISPILDLFQLIEFVEIFRGVCLSYDIVTTETSEALLLRLSYPHSFWIHTYLFDWFCLLSETFSSKKNCLELGINESRGEPNMTIRLYSSFNSYLESTNFLIVKVLLELTLYWWKMILFCCSPNVLHIPSYCFFYAEALASTHFLDCYFVSAHKSSCSFLKNSKGHPPCWMLNSQRKMYCSVGL